MGRLRTWISEMTVTVRGGFGSAWGQMRRTFWPAWSSDVRVNPRAARALYRNETSDVCLGGGFAKPIIDLTVEFMGLPRSATGEEDIDNFLNSCFLDFWQNELQQMVRNACRDSKTIVRVRRKSPGPLVTSQESEACYLEILLPENCDIFFDLDDRTTITRAHVRYEIEEVIEFEPGSEFQEPKVEVVAITEVITPEEYTYWDETNHQWREDLAQSNSWGFVPLIEVDNEYDPAFQGGQSDLETAWPFIKAFHDVLTNALTAHKYHSVPKAKFKLNEIQTFLMNNFPDAFDKDENNRPIPGTFNGTVSWKGTEILFLQAEEDVDFLEASSVLGDSRMLLEFLLDCISIASQTPEWAFMRVEGAGTGRVTSQTLPFVQKIKRKRKMFEPFYQRLAKMALAVNRREPISPSLAWDEISPDDVLAKAQALQMTVMALEVPAQRQVVSDRTYREHLRRHIPEMRGPTEEARDAEDNVSLDVLTPNSQNGSGQASNVAIGQQGRNE